MNEFIKDSGIFLTEAARHMRFSMTKQQVVYSTMNFALGIERILKGILFDINPLFVLESPEFSNSVQILYKDKIIDRVKNEELKSKTNANVISYRKSLLRCRSISKVTSSNLSLLFALSENRDIIAHCQLSNLKYKKLQTLIKRDLYPLIKKYADELDIPISELLGKMHIKTGELSAKFQESIED